MSSFTNYKRLSIANAKVALLLCIALAAHGSEKSSHVGLGVSAIYQSPESAQSAFARYEYTEYHMGVDVRIVVYAASKPSAEQACAAAFERFAQLDTIMSDYRSNSELMRLCSRAGGPAVPVSSDLFLVLSRSQELARRSGGAFDITCGPLVRLWRSARKTGVAPSTSEIDAVRKRIGWRFLELDSRLRTARLRVPGMQLDLGGIAKGYADDCAQTALKQHGISRALIEAGGDIVVSDPPPGKAGWKIQIPNAVSDQGVPELFANAAISTSGDLEQSVEIGGKRYSHIVDPRTAVPLSDRIQVTIVARNGLTSDGLSTAVSVLGAKQGRALARRYAGTKVYVRFAMGTEGTVHSPGRFQKSDE